MADTGGACATKCTVGVEVTLRATRPDDRAEAHRVGNRADAVVCITG